MQTVHNVFKIVETDQKNSLLDILSDKYCRTIIESTTYKPKSVMEITRETHIPMSTTYRKINYCMIINYLKFLELLPMMEKNYSYTKVKLEEFKVYLEMGI